MDFATITYGDCIAAPLAGEGMTKNGGRYCDWQDGILARNFAALDARSSRFHADGEVGIFSDIGNPKRELNLAQNLRVEDSHPEFEIFQEFFFEDMDFGLCQPMFLFESRNFLLVLILYQVTKTAPPQLTALRPKRLPLLFDHNIPS